MKDVTITEVRKRFNAIDIRLLKDLEESTIRVTRKGKPIFMVMLLEDSSSVCYKDWVDLNAKVLHCSTKEEVMKMAFEAGFDSALYG